MFGLYPSQKNESHSEAKMRYVKCSASLPSLTGSQLIQKSRSSLDDLSLAERPSPYQTCATVLYDARPLRLRHVRGMHASCPGGGQEGIEIFLRKTHRIRG